MSFESWWTITGEWVEPPNQRRDGESGVKLAQHPEFGPLYVKLQTNHCYRSLRYPFGRPTVWREHDALAAARALHVPVPEVVACVDRKNANGWQAVLATKALVGYRDLFAWGRRREKGIIQDAVLHEMLEQAGTVIGRLHAGGWMHTNLYPNHVFANHEAGEAPVQVALIDLENSRRVWRKKQAASRDLNQLKKRCQMFTVTEWGLLEDAHWRTFHRT